MYFEVIAQNVEDIIAIQEAGVDRVELVSDMQADGLSPTFDTIESVIAVAKIPIRVMVRFHNRGFIYSKEEIEQMCRWIKHVNSYPIDGFVIGGITEKNTVDTYLIEKCLDAIEDKKCTFHRAFDHLTDQFSALETLNNYAIDTLLTSGGLQQSILNNRDKLNQLQINSQNITILAGGGVTKQVIDYFKSSQITHFHLGRYGRINSDFANKISSTRLHELLNNALCE